ncbi:MAG: methyltransferase domain-containing protein [Planctomycetota bacterium]|nr:methyltransferase domain-containing protein [Planctomycetota bacterium]
MRAAWDLLACSVRGCGLPLARRERQLACAMGHAFDVARSGYVNLLQPQDRRSLAAGDARETVQARLRLRERGLGAAVDEALAGLAARAGLVSGAVVVDLGSGTGDHLAGLAERLDLPAAGFDLSSAAAEAAARRHPGGAWCVANCDRVLPLRSGSVDLALSIDARRPRDELARILKSGGSVVVAVPGPGDLRELRLATLEDARDLPGLARVVEEFAGAFELLDRRETAETLEFDAAGLRDLSLATYRNARRREDERLLALGALRVTIAHEIGLFRARRP